MGNSREYDNLKAIKPYLLVIHPKTGNTAVYDRKYQLMFEGASQRLIRHAESHHTQVGQGFKLSYPEQQPSWMSSEKQEECILYHLYKDSSNIVTIRSIPEG
jgi:hypothetical protein